MNEDLNGVIDAINQEIQIFADFNKTKLRGNTLQSIAEANFSPDIMQKASLKELKDQIKEQKAKEK